MESENTVAMPTRSIWRDFVRLLFPLGAWQWSEKHREFMGESPYTIRIDVHSLLDWKDRLRILASGRVHVETSLRMQNDPGDHSAISRVVVEAWKN